MTGTDALGDLAPVDRHDPEMVARHEAGHVLAGYLLGIKATSVTIDPEHPHTALSLGHAVGLDQVVDRIAVVAMGYEVSEPDFALGGVAVDDLGDDDAVLMVSLAQVCASTVGEIRATVDLGRARARALIDTPEFERAYPPLVAALLQHGSLNEVSIDIIIQHALADDDPSKAGSLTAT